MKVEQKTPTVGQTYGQTQKTHSIYFDIIKCNSKKGKIRTEMKLNYKCSGTCE